MKTLKPIHTHYLGYRATVVTVLTAGPMGERIVIRHWPDGSGPKNGDYPANTSVLARCAGDGRKSTFVRRWERVLLDTDLTQAIAQAEAALREEARA